MAEATLNTEMYAKLAATLNELDTIDPAEIIAKLIELYEQIKETEAYKKLTEVVEQIIEALEDTDAYKKAMEIIKLIIEEIKKYFPEEYSKLESIYRNPESLRVVVNDIMNTELVKEFIASGKETFQRVWEAMEISVKDYSEKLMTSQTSKMYIDYIFKLLQQVRNVKNVSDNFT